MIALDMDKSQPAVSLPAADVRTQVVERVKYASDASHYYNMPEAVVVAKDAAEVAAVFKAAARDGKPVTLRSGGTSLAGQSSGDGILIDTRRHFKDVEVLDRGARVRVQPGATVRQVNARLQLWGYKLGPDPASSVAATVGGVIANNSSGMACGTEFNTYRTLESMTFILPSGTMINTADPDANAQFKAQEPELVETLERLRRRVVDNRESVEIIRRHFQLKNTMGYGLNSFLDFEEPVKLFEHLLIGSEGTLAFVAEAVFRTVPISTFATTTLAVFDDLDSATRALPSLLDSGAATLELMDSSSIRVGQELKGVPAAITGFDVDKQAALLIEYHANEEEELRQLEQDGSALLADLPLRAPAQFSEDPIDRAVAWTFRNGLYASVAGARKSGTTALLEDVVVPVPDLAPTCESLQELFIKYGYDDAVIFGHAKDGNIHFLLTDRFEGDEALGRYNAFNEGMVDLILSAQGNLKAEHGTGRAMAPYVRRQYGDELYDVHLELKRAADPRGTMNPGVIIDDDPDAHIRNIKLNHEVEIDIDRCVECGYCEPVCPSRNLTMTPRQRIATRRAMAKARAEGRTQDAEELAEAYEYQGIDTCAVDSMCVTVCPVGIDTGKFVKKLRSQRTGTKQEVTRAAWAGAAKVWPAVPTVASAALTGVNVLPTGLVQKVTDVARALVGEDIMPEYQPELGKGGKLRSRLGEHVGAPGEPIAVYVPACVNTMFGPSGSGAGATDAFVALAARAGVSLRVPKDIDALCCGTPWTSKGIKKGHAIMEKRVQASLMAATDHGRLPVLSDASSCSEGFKAMAEAAGLTVIDAVTFTVEHILPTLEVKHKVSSITLHPTCSSKHLDIIGDLEAVAKAAAREVHIPADWNCCGYAGDRGMLHPELTASATREEAREVSDIDSAHHASLNRTCELGLSRATGHEYQHVLELLEQASR
ncbi:FAD-binding and (Fe-S)-binding domain-containing protein [Corynebacterium striatum]|uniref:FAD-binding and (Fe-S)-binding domain-containing protein n=1 Tax=Corynebacterium striatum TaxID=43770 RepID=UPI001EF4F73B|nr:FAD-binding and (Fe-S)-binding domain-containing protein [Corynebacterium striatum]MCG7250791.1 FAD-binding oxidoreductase [Corynebacterium striatum]GKH17293.1 oxidoreductase [Corynebacterium striatum]